MRARLRQSATSLLEVLIALTVFSIGALGVLGIVTITTQLNQNSRQSTEATQLGIRQMERLQILPSGGDALFTGCGTRCWLTPALGSQTSAIVMRPADLLGGTIGSALYYQVSWQATSSNGLRYFKVDVHWPKNKALQADATWASTVNCQTAPNLCYVINFHSYRQL